MKTLIAFVLLSAALFLGGCLFEPYRENTEYDLAVAKVEAGYPVEVMELRNNTGGSTRMQTREADGRIVSDPYNHWILQPGELVGRSLNAALAGDGSTPRARLRGGVELFEADAPSKTFRLTAALEATGAVKFRQRFEISVPLRALDAASMVEGAGRAVEILAADVAEKMKR